MIKLWGEEIELPEAKTVFVQGRGKTTLLRSIAQQGVSDGIVCGYAMGELSSSRTSGWHERFENTKCFHVASLFSEQEQRRGRDPITPDNFLIDLADSATCAYATEQTKDWAIAMMALIVDAFSQIAQANLLLGERTARIRHQGIETSWHEAGSHIARNLIWFIDFLSSWDTYAQGGEAHAGWDVIRVGGIYKPKPPERSWNLTDIDAQVIIDDFDLYDTNPTITAKRASALRRLFPRVQWILSVRNDINGFCL